MCSFEVGYNELLLSVTHLLEWATVSSSASENICAETKKKKQEKAGGWFHIRVLLSVSTVNGEGYWRRLYVLTMECGNNSQRDKNKMMERQWIYRKEWNGTLNKLKENSRSDPWSSELER